MKDSSYIRVNNLEMKYDDYTVIKNLTFSVKKGEIFVVMGGSGCGKSTLLKHLIGLITPTKGQIFYDDVDFVNTDPDQRKEFLTQFGVSYQNGALWTSMTLYENVSLVLEQHTTLATDEISEIVNLKLAMVGLKGFEEYYPSEISGGMRKRAGLARAMALDPKILFFDEPSAGLDPINSKRLDDLILEIKDNIGTTIIVVTHELESIFAIADNSIFLDPDTKTMIAEGNPHHLLKHSNNPKVIQFLKRST